MIKNKAIILARVSTSEQEYEAQISDLQKYAKGLGYSDFKIVANKESGFKSFDKREGFSEVIEIINSGEGYNTIICTELSRLSRNEVVLQQIKAYLVANKIQLIVKDNNFFLINSNGEVDQNTNLVFSIFASAAAYEMQKIKRFLRARKELAAQGYSLGGKQLFGYIRVFDEDKRKTTYIINEDEKAEILDVFTKYVNETISIRDLTLYCIAKKYSKYLHSKRNVTKLLSESAYTGLKTTHNKRKNAEYWNYGNTDAPKYVDCGSREMKYPIIISKALFNLAQQKKLANRANADKSTKYVTLLSKLIKCVDCGTYLTANYRIRDGRLAHSYRCSRRHTVNDCINKGCYSLPLLDSVIWCFVKDNVSMLVEQLNNETSDYKQKELKEFIETINNEIERVLAGVKTAKRLYEINKIIDADKALADYETEIKRIANEKEYLEKQRDKYQLELDRIKATKRSDIEKDMQTKIDEIENSKELLSKYIHNLISEIRIISNNSSYMVLEVDAVCDMGFRMDFSGKDLRNLLSKNPQNAEREKATPTYYIVISKSNGRLIKVRYFLKYHTTFENGYFHTLHNNYKSSAISLADIFGYNIELREQLENISDNNLRNSVISEYTKNTLLFDVEILPYKRLEFY